MCITPHGAGAVSALLPRGAVNSKSNRYIMHANNLTAPATLEQTSFGVLGLQQPSTAISGIESALSNLIAGAIWGGQ
jgi:hypothetical protein